MQGKKERLRKRLGRVVDKWKREGSEVKWDSGGCESEEEGRRVKMG